MAVPPESQQLEQRIIALEEWSMHTDQLLEKFNGVLCVIQSRLDDQERSIAQLKESIQQPSNGDEENRSLEDERPPHY